MKRDKYQSLALPEKLLKLKEAYLQGKYQQLIIHDQYIYPPIEKDIKEILISQFGISLLDQYIKNFTEQKITKKTKFPLPIIFAFIHHNIKANRYENLVRMIMQYVDRKTVEHFYILIYIIAKIYERFKQYKKSIFYLENLLKESPFFSQGVYDLCYHYAFRFQREQEACSILERHIGHFQPNQKFIHSLYIRICSKSKSRNSKDVMKTLNNKSMNLVAYYNLGVFLRQNEDLQKAFEIFTEILAKLSKAKQDQTLNFTQKDKKLLLYSKVNLLMILKSLSYQQNKSAQQIQALTKQIEQGLGYNLDHQAMSKTSLYKQNSNSVSSQSLKSQKIFRNFFSTRKSKELSALKQYKQEKTMQNEQKSIQNKENYKLSSFNNEFSTIRQYNNKKLKYLLQKQKQINHFFQNLVIKKDDNSDKMLIAMKMKERALKSQASQLSIIKAKSLKSDEFQFFQKQFENKRKIHQFKYDNIELESMLTQIMTNFETCVVDNKTQTKMSSIAKSYTQTIKASPSRQNQYPSKHSMLQNTPKSSLGPRKTEKTDKRIILSQMTNRTLKSDRGNFRIKPINKQPHKEIKEQKQEQLLVEARQDVSLPTLRKTNKQIQMDSKQKKSNQQKKQIQQNKLATIERKQQIVNIKKNTSEQTSLKSLEAVSNHEVALSNPHSAHNSYTNCQQNIFGKDQNRKEILSQRQPKHTEKSIVSDQNDGHTQVKEVPDNYMLSSHTTSVGCYTLNPTEKQVFQAPAQQQPSYNEDNYDQIVEEKAESVKIKPISKQEQNLFKQTQEKSIEELKTTQQQKVYLTKAAQVQKEQPKKPEPGKQLQLQPVPIPESKPAYDPFASSFQLTGFGKSSLSKFSNLKKKRKTSPRQSVNQQEKKMAAEPPSKTAEYFKSSQNMSQFQQQIKQGEALEKAEKYQSAYQLYTRLYKTYKKQTQKQIVLVKIGDLFETQQRYAEAQKTYLKCTKFNNVEAFIKLGALLLKNGRINSGVENIEKANCLKRNDLQIENKLVYGYSLRDQTMEKALDLAQMILKKEPQSLQTLIITANILEKQGKIKEAIDIITAIDKFKSAQYIKHYLGVLQLQDSNLTEAFNHFKAALSIKPDYLPSLIEVATIISEISPKQSISILEKVLEIEPHNRKALARLGKIYESIENDFSSAMNAYQTALQTQENYESYIKIGDCLARQQSYIEALINYKEALNMKKTHEAYAKVANMFQMKEEYTKAIQNYQQALNLLVADKDHNCAKKKEYLTYLGNLSLRIGNYDTGIKFFQEIDDYEDSIDILKLLAEAYFGKKQYSIALQKYQKASELSHGQKLDILQNIAICFDKMEQYLASKAIYEKILEKDSENIRCMNNLANILLITGETNESFYLFQSMLQKAPKNLEKRLKVVDIYAQVGDWSKVEFHLLQCLKQKDNDERVIERLINLYKEKRDIKMANKYEKRLAMVKNSRKGQQKAATYS